jgi:hypothetical protein
MGKARRARRRLEEMEPRERAVYKARNPGALGVSWAGGIGGYSGYAVRDKGYLKGLSAEDRGIARLLDIRYSDPTYAKVYWEPIQRAIGRLFQRKRSR